MRTRALLLALLLVPLAGCLDDPTLHARLEETRDSLARSNGDVLNMSAEVRAWRDNASSLANESAWTRLQRDDLHGMLNVTADALAAREADLANATQALEAATQEATRLGFLLAEAEKVTSDNKTLADLTRGLAEAENERARLQRLYDDALASRFNALTSISRGNATWQFTDLRGDTHQWRYPMEEYRKDVKRSRPSDGLYMTTTSGTNIRVPDPRPYVDAEPFRGVISDLTDGRGERDFVREVFHLKRQLVVYEFQLVDEKGYYKYPGETLVEGTGICGDTTILLQSLLAAGKEQAGYGFETALWVVDWNLGLGRLIENPQSVNHAFIEVRFSDGEVWYVETTSYEFVTHPAAHGFRFAW